MIRNIKIAYADNSAEGAGKEPFVQIEVEAEKSMPWAWDHVWRVLDAIFGSDDFKVVSCVCRYMQGGYEIVARAQPMSVEGESLVWRKIDQPDNSHKGSVGYIEVLARRHGGQYVLDIQDIALANIGFPDAISLKMEYLSV